MKTTSESDSIFSKSVVMQEERVTRLREYIAKRERKEAKFKETVKNAKRKWKERQVRSQIRLTRFFARNFGSDN